MLNLGDTVKVIGKTTTFDENGDEVLKELIPIGTICTITIVDGYANETLYEVTPLGDDYGFMYDANSLEKGHTEWIKDE